MEEENKKLDDFLNQYHIPKSNVNLAQNIVGLAMQEQQIVPIWVYLKEALAELHLPSPQYSFSFLLLLSFCVGVASYTSPEIVESLLNNSSFL
jgi:hypothetical protein